MISFDLRCESVICNNNPHIDLYNNSLLIGQYIYTYIYNFIASYTISSSVQQIKNDFKRIAHAGLLGV